MCAAGESGFDGIAHHGERLTHPAPEFRRAQPGFRGLFREYGMAEAARLGRRAEQFLE